MGWKYVMMEITLGEHMNPADSTKMLMPFIFPDKVAHDMMSEAAKAVLAACGMKNATVASAGRIEHILPESVGGNSDSLGIAAGPEDTMVIETYSYHHGIRP